MTAAVVVIWPVIGRRCAVH